MRMIIIITLMLSMAGCSIFDKKEPVKTAPKEVEKLIHHPPPIRPLSLNSTVEYKTLTPKTKKDVLAADQYVFQCMPWVDYLALGQNMQSIITKFEEYEKVLCHYRKELKEDRCKKYKVPKEKAK